MIAERTRNVYGDLMVVLCRPFDLYPFVTIRAENSFNHLLTFRQ